MKRTALAFLLAAALCLGGLTTPAHAQLSISVDIGTPPPERRVEIVPAPRPGWIWTPGFWGWEEHRHVWHEGRWLHSRPGMQWIAPRWHRHGDRYRFAPGHWISEGHHERDRWDGHPERHDNGWHNGWHHGHDRRP